MRALHVDYRPYGMQAARLSPVLSRKRVESIDLLRGTVMIIMALDHVRDYFHYDAFIYSPTDLGQTSPILFFTRWITHYSAPIFVFLAGVSAWLYGSRRSNRELAFFLFTRGLWLVFVELFILSLFRTFNPTYPYFNLQVIWAIGLCMMILSALIYLPRRIVLLVGILLVAGHNLLDTVHVSGNGAGTFLWSVLHDPGRFQYGHFSFNIRYPILPWVGIMAIGYYFGSFYGATYDPTIRRKSFLSLGFAMILVFIFLRSGNFYGDAAHWTKQPTVLYNILSFLNTTKYPPSLLYTLMTLGPALVFLSLTERPLRAWTNKIVLFGRVPMFYYLAHILLIHILATIAAIFSGYQLSFMILSNGVNDSPGLKGYGFSLLTVYLVWIALIVILYPLCKWFDRYKRMHLLEQPWLSYL